MKIQKISRGSHPRPPAAGKSGEENQVENLGVREGNRVGGNFIHPWLIFFCQGLVCRKTGLSSYHDEYIQLPNTLLDK